MANQTDRRTEWSYAEYARLPDDGNRYEVIDGELLMTPAPGPPHQVVAANLFERLRGYIRRHDLGEIYWDVDLLFATGQYLRPDMVFVPKAGLEGVTDRGVESVPGLVVEVLSPSSREIDRSRKPACYRAFGVPEYWVADREARSLEMYRSARGIEAPEIRTTVAEWQPDAGVAALEIAVPELFEDV